VPTELWDVTRSRQAELDRRGACGGGFSKISAAHFGGSTARNKGATACANLLTIWRLAEGAQNKTRPGGEAEALVAQMKMVAGAGNHRKLTPLTTRC
jgi:hypothetical protein